MKECFTCANKISRELSKEEREELQKQSIAATGRKTLFIPEMEFTCKVTGKKISQIDPACDHYSGDTFMEGIRKDIAKTASKMRKELNNH